MILSTTESNAQLYNWSSRPTFTRQVFTISVEMVNPQYPPTTFLKPLTTLRNYSATSCKVKNWSYKVSAIFVILETLNPYQLSDWQREARFYMDTRVWLTRSLALLCLQRAVPRS